MDRRNTRRFQLVYGSAHVDGISIAGIEITDHRNVHCLDGAADMLGEHRQIHQTRVGASEQTRRYAVARHIDGLETRHLDQARTVGVIDARNRKDATVSQSRLECRTFVVACMGSPS
jgi:hypothetical protein